MKSENEIMELYLLKLLPLLLLLQRRNPRLHVPIARNLAIISRTAGKKIQARNLPIYLKKLTKLKLKLLQFQMILNLLHFLLVLLKDQRTYITGILILEHLTTLQSIKKALPLMKNLINPRILELEIRIILQLLESELFNYLYELEIKLKKLHKKMYIILPIWIAIFYQQLL